MFHNSFKLAKRYKKVRSLFSHFQTQFPKWSAKIGASSLARAPKRSPTQNSNSPCRLASFRSASPPLLTPPTPLSPLLSSPTPLSPRLSTLRPPRAASAEPRLRRAPPLSSSGEAAPRCRLRRWARRRREFARHLRFPYGFGASGFWSAAGVFFFWFVRGF